MRLPKFARFVRAFLVLIAIVVYLGSLPGCSTMATVHDLAEVRLEHVRLERDINCEIAAKNSEIAAVRADRPLEKVAFEGELELLKARLAVVTTLAGTSPGRTPADWSSEAAASNVDLTKLRALLSR